MYNLLNCAGWATADAGTRIAFGGPCMSSKLMIVVLFFLIAIIRKWGGEEMGFEFNFLFALIFGLVSYLLLITFTGSVGLSFGIGLFLSLVGGYGAPYMFGGGGYD